MSQGYGQGQGYAQQPAPEPPKKKGPRLWLWVLIGVPTACVGFGVIGAAGAGRKAGEQALKTQGFTQEQIAQATEQARKATEAAAVAQQQATQKAAAEAAANAVAAATQVPIQTLLSEYKDNEIRADGQFKGKLIRVTGKVDDVKKDIMGSPYVTLGTGKDFEIPQVQCMFADGQEGAAAQLSKGKSVTVTGRVDGLMMNVLVRECSLQ